MRQLRLAISLLHYSPISYLPTPLHLSKKSSSHMTQQLQHSHEQPNKHNTKQHNKNTKKKNQQQKHQQEHYTYKTNVKHRVRKKRV
ncbi:protein tweety-like [Culex pipiens pallens]|uniref:protein tweety-like n=1 Tax=Culex pipiens pallens TaxID=42434 RepID=UPI0022AA58FC|nr:protein tweety-like [Culex pipiens pallens]